jgi:hypothetical protein
VDVTLAKSSKSSSSSSSGTHHGGKQKASGVKRDRKGKIARSSKAKDEFNFQVPIVGRNRLDIGIMSGIEARENYPFPRPAMLG